MSALSDYLTQLYARGKSTLGLMGAPNYDPSLFNMQYANPGQSGGAPPAPSDAASNQLSAGGAWPYPTDDGNGQGGYLTFGPGAQQAPPAPGQDGAAPAPLGVGAGSNGADQSGGGSGKSALGLLAMGQQGINMMQAPPARVAPMQVPQQAAYRPFQTIFQRGF